MKIASPPRRNHKVKFEGGPWHGMTAWVPNPQFGCPKSMVFRVGDHVGQYDLVSGRWVGVL